MDYLGTVESAPKTIPEGTYKAFPSRIEKKEIDSNELETENNTIVQITFTLVTDDEFNNRLVNGICSPNINERLKLGNWIKAITGIMPQVGEQINKEDILYKNCKVVVKHTLKDRLYENVSKVQPLDEKDTEENDEPPF